MTAWNDVTEATVANCFRRDNISEENQKDALDDTGDPFKALDEDLTQLIQKDPTLMPEDITAVDIVDTDATGEEIFAEFFPKCFRSICRIYVFLEQKREQKCKVFCIDLKHYICVIKSQQRNNLVFWTTLRENKLSIIDKLIFSVITHLIPFKL